MEGKGIKITGKDIGVLVMILGMVITFFVKFEVMKVAVSENTKARELNPPEVIVNNQKNMAEDIGEIKDDLKGLVDAWYEYLQSQ